MKKREMPEAEVREDVAYFYSPDEKERMGAKWINGKVHTWIEKVEGEDDDKEDKKEKKKIKIIEVLSKIITTIFIFLSLFSGILYNGEYYIWLLTGISIITILIILLLILIMYIRTLKDEPFSLRSKHSAEHRIINFLIKNDRIPTVEELENANRFTINCGGIDGNCTFEEISATIISSIIAAIIGMNVTDYIAYYYYGEKIVFLTIITIMITMGIKIILANIVCTLLIIISQFVTTTKLTQESDRELLIELAKQYMNWQGHQDNLQKKN